MARTDTVRGWFNETVSNHNHRGTDGYKPRCNWGISEPVVFPAEGGGVYVEPVHPATVEAFEAFVMLMEHYGETMPSAGGVDSCRNIAGTDWPSLHAYLVAVDLPPNGRVGDDFLEAALRIRTNNGAQVFLNGRVFNDRMHFQLNCSQSDLATGIDWSTVEGEDMVDRKTDVGPNPALENVFKEAKRVGVFSEFTDAGSVVFADELAAFLDRAGVLGLKKDLAELKQAIAELSAQLDDIETNPGDHDHSVRLVLE